jgi:predicted PurR-regulated permease PerM
VTLPDRPAAGAGSASPATAISPPGGTPTASGTGSPQGETTIPVDLLEIEARRARRRRERRLIVLAAAVAILLWLARPVVGPFVVAAVLAYAFSPLVAAGERRLSIPRVLVIAIGYFVAFVVLAVLFYLGAGPLARELELLATKGPDAFGTGLRQLLGSDTITIGTTQVQVRDIAAQLQNAVSSTVSSPGDALHVAGTVGEVALQAILAIIVMFYFLLDGSRFAAFGLGFLPPADRQRTQQILDRIHIVLGRWLRGQLLLIALVAAVVYLVLGPVLHIHYALALAVLSGVLEILPLVGPITAAALAATFALGQAGTETAIFVVVFYFVLRQVEDQIVMPIVIGRVVHLHPVVTIFAVLVGLSVWGVLGGLLGVPVAAALNVTLHELFPEARAAA